MDRKPNPHGIQVGYGPISPTPPWRSARHFTEEERKHNCLNMLAEQHVYRQEQSRQALNFQHADFERTAQEYEQAARDEVHVAVAQATEVPEAEMREVMVLSTIKQSKLGLLIK